MFHVLTGVPQSSGIVRLVHDSGNLLRTISEMGLGRLEPEAPQGPETTEDWPEANRRSTTDLTLIRRSRNMLDSGKMP